MPGLEPDFLQFNDLVCETVGGKVSPDVLLGHHGHEMEEELRVRTRVRTSRSALWADLFAVVGSAFGEWTAPLSLGSLCY